MGPARSSRALNRLVSMHTGPHSLQAHVGPLTACALCWRVLCVIPRCSSSCVCSPRAHGAHAGHGVLTTGGSPHETPLPPLRTHGEGAIGAGAPKRDTTGISTLCTNIFTCVVGLKTLYKLMARMRCPAQPSSSCLQTLYRPLYRTSVQCRFCMLSRAGCTECRSTIPEMELMGFYSGGRKGRAGTLVRVPYSLCYSPLCSLYQLVDTVQDCCQVVSFIPANPSEGVAVLWVGLGQRGWFSVVDSYHSRIELCS